MEEFVPLAPGFITEEKIATHYANTVLGRSTLTTTEKVLYVGVAALAGLVLAKLAVRR